MLANIKKTALATAIIATATTGFASVATAAERSELTIHPKEYTTFVRNFNPYLGATNLHTTTDFLYEPLVVFNEMHGNTPVFRLAENFKMADDLMSVTFDIRKGVKWSDGETFSADDVVFSFNLVKEKPAELADLLLGYSEVGIDDLPEVDTQDAGAPRTEQEPEGWSLGTTVWLTLSGLIMANLCVALLLLWRSRRS